VRYHRSQKSVIGRVTRSEQCLLAQAGKSKGTEADSGSVPDNYLFLLTLSSQRKRKPACETRRRILGYKSCAWFLAAHSRPAQVFAPSARLRGPVALSGCPSARTHIRMQASVCVSVASGTYKASAEHISACLDALRFYLLILSILHLCCFRFSS
jgi:hypothetical protein